MLRPFPFFVLPVLLSLSGTAGAQSDFRAPAYPLITVDPYFSIWSFSDTLYASPTRHWTGKPQNLQGILRVDGRSLYFMGQPPEGFTPVLPRIGPGHPAAYTFQDPGPGWNLPKRNLQGWKFSTRPFSDEGRNRTAWTGSDIWTRQYFNWNSRKASPLWLQLHHDDQVEVYINGLLVYKNKGWNSGPDWLPIGDIPGVRLGRKDNVLAIHCRNTAGASYLNAGLGYREPDTLSFGHMTQDSVWISATQTRYRFHGGKVELTLTFTAPLLADALDTLSRPVDYISFRVRSLDGHPHQVQCFFSAAGNLSVNTPDEPVVWKREQVPNLRLMRVGTSAQLILGRKGDDVRIDWGYLYLGVPDTSAWTTSLSADLHNRRIFSRRGFLPDDTDPDTPRAAGQRPVTLAADLDLGKVGSSWRSGHMLLGYDDRYSIEYFHRWLRAWWRRMPGSDGQTMMQEAETDYTGILARCDWFDRWFRQNARSVGGRDYERICELAYRQSLAAQKLVADTDDRPLYFNKECFSNGSIGTVDVTYPSSPLLLLFNPTLLKGLLKPIFYYCSSGAWKKPIAPHDIGTYPIADGQTYPEDMPVEECGNMILLSTAVCRAEHRIAFARKHWDLLSLWAGYLRKEGFDPANQLCTDDFAGHLAHNANLSLKAILALAAYSQLARQMGETARADSFSRLALGFAVRWQQMDQDGNHYSLTFHNPGTWSQKYNLIWDRMLNLHIFPDSVSRKELSFYLTRQKRFGLPLDSRKTYTKSDWILWTASMAGNGSRFRALVRPVYRYITQTPSRVPISDWHDTVSGKKVGFQARSVVGGYFMEWLNKKWHPLR